MTDASDHSKPRLLIVDDVDLVRDVLRAVLAGAGYEVLTAADADAALAAAASASIQVALVDVGLGADSGGELCRRLRALTSPPGVILMSGADAPDLAALDATGFLAKPCRPHELLARVADALRRR